MAVMTRTPRDAKGWTVADLEHLPDDGNRYELLDGELLVSPAPTRRHQAVAFEVGKLLDAACPQGLAVLVAPLDWQPDGRTSFQPDVLVIRNENMNARNVTDSLILAVEVLSPSTRRVDLLKKRVKYESAKVPSYWVVDPDLPSLLAFDLVEGRYQVVGKAEQDQGVELEHPFPITVRPASLLERYNW